MVKQQAKPNDLLERIRSTSYFKPLLPELETLVDPTTFIGRSPEIVEKLVTTKVKPALQKYAEALATAKVADLKV